VQLYKISPPVDLPMTPIFMATLIALIYCQMVHSPPLPEYTFSNTYPLTGLSLSFQAAAAETEETGGNQAREKPLPFKESDTHDFFKTFHREGPSKRKRNGTIAKPKDEDQATLLKDIWGEDDEWEEQEDEKAKENGVLVFQQEPPITTADARAIELHSGVAFRRPSTASKKYTRKFSSSILFDW
jgi:hypothetical protein